MPFRNEEKEDGSWHTIDGDRDAELLLVRGAMPKFPWRFALVWEGRRIKFKAAGRLKEIVPAKKIGGEGRVVEMRWRIFGIVMPDAPETKWPELAVLIREALEAFGYCFNKSLADVIIVEFWSNAWDKYSQWA